MKISGRGGACRHRRQRSGSRAGSGSAPTRRRRACDEAGTPRQAATSRTAPAEPARAAADSWNAAPTSSTPSRLPPNSGARSSAPKVDRRGRRRARSGGSARMFASPSSRSSPDVGVLAVREAVADVRTRPPTRSRASGRDVVVPLPAPHGRHEARRPRDDDDLHSSSFRTLRRSRILSPTAVRRDNCVPGCAATAALVERLDQRRAPGERDQEPAAKASPAPGPPARAGAQRRLRVCRLPRRARRPRRGAQ